MKTSGKKNGWSAITLASAAHAGRSRVDGRMLDELERALEPWIRQGERARIMRAVDTALARA
jgi:hypothetical protein